MLRRAAGLLLFVIVGASGAAACDLAMVDGLEKRGYTRDEVAQICSTRPQKAGETAKSGSQDEPAEPSPAKVGGSAPSDKLMERPKHEPLKIDDPIEFMRGYWRVTWRVTNVPNFPSRVLVLRFSGASAIGLTNVVWGLVEGSNVPKIIEKPLEFGQLASPNGLWIDDLARKKSVYSSEFVGIGFFSERKAQGGRAGVGPSIVIDLSGPTSRDTVKGGFSEHSGDWSLIGELEFERIPEDRLIEVLKALN